MSTWDEVPNDIIFSAIKMIKKKIKWIKKNL